MMNRGKLIVPIVLFMLTGDSRAGDLSDALSQARALAGPQAESAVPAVRGKDAGSPAPARPAGDCSRFDRGGRPPAPPQAAQGPRKRLFLSGLLLKNIRENLRWRPGAATATALRIVALHDPSDRRDEAVPVSAIEPVHEINFEDAKKSLADTVRKLEPAGDEIRAKGFFPMTEQAKYWPLTYATPIRVVKNPESGAFYVIDGNGRLEAIHQALGDSLCVEVEIVQDDSKLAAALAQRLRRVRGLDP